MFNFGDDDKKKLRENMEEIKDMVEEGDKKEGMETGEGGKDSFQKFSGGGQKMDQGVQEFDDTGEPERPEQVESNNAEDESFDEEFGTGREPGMDKGTDQTVEQGNVQSFEESTGDRKEQDVESTGRSSERGSRTEKVERDELERDIPEPPETEDIDVPEIDKGPLFIKRKKFDNAKKLIEQMRYISSEMEAVMNDLEAGVKQDQQIESDLKDMLHGFDQDRSTVKEIISPSEEGE